MIEACDILQRLAPKRPTVAPVMSTCHVTHVQAWDMAAEMCLLQLPALLSGEPGADFQPSPFFAEQLTAFELWLAHGSVGKQPPEQLPIVLQVPWALVASSGPCIAGCRARWLACAHEGQRAVQESCSATRCCWAGCGNCARWSCWGGSAHAAGRCQHRRARVPSVT